MVAYRKARPGSADAMQFGAEVLLGGLAHRCHNEGVAKDVSVYLDRPRDRCHLLGGRAEAYKAAGKLELGAVKRDFLVLGDAGGVSEDDLYRTDLAEPPVTGLGVQRPSVRGAPGVLEVREERLAGVAETDLFTVGEGPDGR